MPFHTIKITIKSRDKLLFMVWYALEDLDEALEKTKDILLPFDLLTWTKFAIIALLVGGGLNMQGLPPVPGQGGDTSESLYTPDKDIDAGENFTEMGNVTGMASGAELNGVAVAIFIVAVIIGGFFAYISSVFEFIYFQSVLDEKPVISKGFSEHAGKGLRYLGFKFGLLLVVALSALLLAGAFTMGTVMGAIALILWIPFILAVVVFIGLVHDLVLLRMIESEEALLEAWSSVWPDVKAEWKQVVVFYIVKFFVNIGVGFAKLMILLGALFVLIIPFGILAFLMSMITPILAVPVALLGIAVLAAIMFYVEVPFTTYIFTYVTLFYHDLTS